MTLPEEFFLLLQIDYRTSTKVGPQPLFKPSCFLLFSLCVVCFFKKKLKDKSNPKEMSNCTMYIGTQC